MDKKLVLVLAEHNNITGIDFKIIGTKLYVRVVTLSVNAINDNIKFLVNLKQKFKRKFSWNKYRFEIKTQPKNNNLDYMIDPTLRDINRLFVLSFKTSESNPTRNSFVLSITYH